MLRPNCFSTFASLLMVAVGAGCAAQAPGPPIMAPAPPVASSAPLKEAEPPMKAEPSETALVATMATPETAEAVQHATQEVAQEPTEQPLEHIEQLSVGYGYACARLKGGRVACWGANRFGQVNGTPSRHEATPVLVPNIDDAVEVAAGYGFSCARRRGGKISCWGNRLAGKNRPFVSTDALADATQIHASHGQLAAIRSDGTAWCWGNTACVPDHEDSPTVEPRALPNVSGVRKFARFYHRSCVVLEGGGLKCWGSYALRQYRDSASMGWRNEPSDIELAHVVDAAMGTSHTCALTADGHVHCWGLGMHGSLGHGSLAMSATPVRVKGLEGVRALGGGSQHSCAVTNQGQVWCWGSNRYGELGRGRVGEKAVPKAGRVEGLPSATYVDGGGDYSCALLSNGTARCWGKNSYGALGTGKIGGPSKTPRVVVAPANQ